VYRRGPEARIWGFLILYSSLAFCHIYAIHIPLIAHVQKNQNGERASYCREVPQLPSATNIPKYRSPQQMLALIKENPFSDSQDQEQARLSQSSCFTFRLEQAEDVVFADCSNFASVCSSSNRILLLHIQYIRP